MRQIIYVRTLRIWVEPGAERLGHSAPSRFEHAAGSAPEPRNVTPRTASRRIPVRVRGEGWMDRARRALDRLGRRADAWMRKVARP